MKIALIYPLAPFVCGGTEILINDFENELIKREHDVDVFALPYSLQSISYITEAMINMKSLRFDDYDKLIICKFPCFYIEHQNITYWIFHQFRQVYELLDTEFGLSSTSDIKAFKSIVEKNDFQSLNNAKIFIIAQEVKNRLKLFNNVDSEVLFTPQKNISSYKKGSVGNYIFYPSRVNSFKRQLLLVEAMQHVKSDIRLVIAGKYEEDIYNEKIQKTIQKFNMRHKIEYLNYFISNEDKIDLISNALAVANIPYKEDSCGLVTFEAFYSHKPIITCYDSGGTLDFVDDGRTGYITEPAPEKIAEALDKLYNDKINAEQMGENAYNFVTSQNINWEDTIMRLLA